MIVELRPPSTSIIRNEIMKAIVSDLNKSLSNGQGQAQREIRKFTKKVIERSKFYADFNNGSLRGEFGIRPQEIDIRIESIVKGIVDDTHLIFNPLTLSGTTISGGWILAMGTDLFKVLKSMQAGITLTEKGEFLPWLQWTLEEGNKIIISDYRILFRFLAGRSGLAIMIPDDVVGWRVPPSFAGTDYDNWITREVLQYTLDYADIVRKHIVRNL